jgi:hypothetical protein
VGKYFQARFQQRLNPMLTLSNTKIINEGELIRRKEEGKPLTLVKQLWLMEVTRSGKMIGPPVE